MTTNDLALLRAILRHDLAAFIQKVFETVSPGAPYLHNWHIEASAYALQLMLEGDITRLVVTQPPRSLKSIGASVAFVAWALGHDPTRRFICVSYSQEFAQELHRQCRMVVNSRWYRDLFPGMRLARDTDTEFITRRGGGRLATSIGGTLTGRGADFIVIDDPQKAAEIGSAAARQEVIAWFETALLSRLDDKSKGGIAVVMQRLHEEDLAGHLLERGGWDHLDLPAIALEDQEIVIGPRAEDIYDRMEGEVLHPARESRETLERIKAEIGARAFSAQYQQRPVPAEGNLLKRTWFQFYDERPSEDRIERLVQSWDVASTTNDSSNYSVCTTWAIVQKDLYLLDVWRDRLDYPDLKKKVIALQAKYRAETVLIEAAGIGENLIQDLTKTSPERFPRPIRIRPDGDKQARMEAASAWFENGQVFLPPEAPWLDTFMHELLAFPHGRHDDQVDSVSQFLNWRRKNQRDGLGFAPTHTYLFALGEKQVNPFNI